MEKYSHVLSGERDRAAKDPNKEEISRESSNSVAIGLGVALGLVVLLWAVSAFWQFRTNRKQKATIAQLTGSMIVEVKDDPYCRGGYQQAHAEVERDVVGSELDSSARKAQPAELGH
ncbi:uncharacterized protein RAG0_10078 [Rhynchosporium agropyri]|uniref:Uncharacterized protein n=1 Tax=Rhynchosporium agropyri TaxID=914238 RepID=A0A1E1KYD7_9HELO|nr:uncharacterized protein RAG0_10078 [Rhynchosporium agropyri]